MNDNSTPIFNQLSRQRGYERLIADGPIDLRPVSTLADTFFSRGPRMLGKFIGDWGIEIAKEEESMPARMTENVHRMDLMDQGVEFHEFVRELAERFNRHYPNITSGISVTMNEELDGTTTVIVAESTTPREQTDESVNAAPIEPITVKKLSEVQQEEPQNPAAKYDNPELYKNVRVIRTDPKLIEDQLSVLNGWDSTSERESETSIGEDTAEALHMKSPIWGSNEE